MKFLNKAIILTILTVGMALAQSLLSHITTTDYGHNFFSEYFFAELAIILLVVFTRLKNINHVISSLAIFIFEIIWFLIYERPYSPEELIMMIIGVMRIYILIGLFKKQTHLAKSNEPS